MKHTEQLQQRLPSSVATRTDTLNVAETRDGKESTGRKCCGGGANNNE